MDCSTSVFPLSFTISWSLVRLMSTVLVMLSNHLISCHPLYPFAFNLSQHQSLFQRVGSSHQVPKYWTFSISSSSEYSGLISFRIHWFDLLAVQGTLKSLLQHHSSKASILSLKGVLLADHSSYVLSHAVPGTMMGCLIPLVDEPGNSSLISPVLCLTPYTPFFFF